MTKKPGEGCCAGAQAIPDRERVMFFLLPLLVIGIGLGLALVHRL